LLILPFKLPILLISRSEDPYDPICVLAPAPVCPHVLSRAALFSLLAPSWPCPVGSSQAHPAPPPPAPPRSPHDCPACRLSSSLKLVVGPAPSPVRPWHEVKSRRGAPKRLDTEGFACPNRTCPSSGITDAHMHAPSRRWHAWPGFAHPDLSRPCLPHDVHCTSPHPFVPFENPLPSGRRGADGASLWAGPFRGLAGLRLPASDHHQPFCPARARMLRFCTSAPSAPSGSRTFSWTNCARGYAAPNTCCGWPSTPARSFFPSSNSAPARNTWRIGSSILCDRSWPSFCLPLFTSDGLNLYFYASRGPFWPLARVGSSRAKSTPVAGSGRPDLWPGEKKRAAA
jgi:hypothetical protein